MTSKNISFLLADVTRMMRREYQKRSLSMTVMQARTLLNVFRFEGIRQIDLAEILEIQPIALVRLIDQLAKDGLVERRVDPADRRAYQLFLTAAADDKLTYINKVANDVRDKAFNGVTEEEIEQLEALLRRINANLHDNSTD